MKKTILKQFFLGTVCSMAVVLPAAAQQFIDCSEGNANCDVLYASEDVFVDNVQNREVKTTDKPLAESKPMEVLPAGNSGNYRVVLPNGSAATATIGNSGNYSVVLPKGATVASDASNPVPGTVVVPDKKTNSRVDVMPDGSIKTTTIEVTTEPTSEGGYQETTHRIERLDTEKKGGVWVEKSLVEKIDYGDETHDWEAARGETLRSLLMQWGEVSGWTVIWKLDKDYKLEAGVVFRGTFTEVASAIIRTFARAVPAPIGTFYKGNRVLVVSVQEDENAH
ncbi:MAG: toxin co-regulated pilus biosynthesis Q family protein [Alphaproteobacteria bacterium]|nr:toxin co-regulated pilus biosynthesis Q family protein [Alphaproteobacteria bacterium]